MWKVSHSYTIRISTDYFSEYRGSERKFSVFGLFSSEFESNLSHREDHNSVKHVFNHAPMSVTFSLSTSDCEHKARSTIHLQSGVDSENWTDQRWKFVISAYYHEILAEIWPILAPKKAKMPWNVSLIICQRLFKVSPVIHTKWGWIREHLGVTSDEN